MSNWSDNVAASARTRLVIPAGRMPCDFAEAFHRFLKIEERRIRSLHRGGAGGREVCAARAVLFDVLFQRLIEGYWAALATGGIGGSLALVALGGYGRAELSPYSDVEVLLLHDGPASDPGPPLGVMKERLAALLASIGLDCLVSIRNPAGCVEEAAKTVQSRTSFLEARLVWGEAEPFERVRSQVRAGCKADAYIAERIRDQEERRNKWGRSFCLLEPNVKNGCGGLRDFQALLWTARVTRGIDDPTQLLARGGLDRAEARLVEDAYDFLLRVRNEIHYRTDRRTDVLARALQPVIARGLGYRERSFARRVERFMGDYFDHVRTLHRVARTLEQRLELGQPAWLRSLGEYIKHPTPFQESVVDGFRLREGGIEPTSARVFRSQPRRLMRVFLLAQQHGLPLHPDLGDLVRRDLRLVDDAFLDDVRVHTTFLEILNQRGNVGRTLRSMHETGFLGKYIPAFHALTCRVQHEFFHVYTTDEHTLVCIEMLDRIWDARVDPFRQYAEIFRAIDSPHVLYLALLLHDVGKALDTRDHAADGVRIALDQANRLRLPLREADSVAFLVRHHLLMARLSQKFDLDDREVVRDFAATVQTVDQLNLLTLHTFADTMGTSESMWTPFKESLLGTLHRRAGKMLTGDDVLRGAEEERVARIKDEVRPLVAHAVEPDEIEAHLTLLPDRYFLLHTPREIAGDISLARRFMLNQVREGDRALDPVISWHSEPDRGYSIVRICTWDRPRLFNRVAGAIAAANLNILGARIFSRPDGPAFDTLFVNDPQAARPPSPAARSRFQELLTASLRGNDVDFRARIAANRHAGPMYRPASYDLIPNRVVCDNTLARDRTVIEIQTEDRVGLLYEVTSALAELNLDVAFARINTEKGAAMDTFHVTGPLNARITRDDRLREIERRLLAALTAGRPETPENH